VCCGTALLLPFTYLVCLSIKAFHALLHDTLLVRGLPRRYVLTVSYSGNSQMQLVPRSASQIESRRSSLRTAYNLVAVLFECGRTLFIAILTIDFALAIDVVMTQFMLNWT
jgi:hypothetical protein